MPSTAREAKVHFQSPEHQHHQGTSLKWVLPSPAGDGGAEPSMIEEGMMQMQHKVHDYMTSESGFITDQHLCLGAASQQQPPALSLAVSQHISPCKAVLPVGSSPSGMDVDHHCSAPQPMLPGSTSFPEQVCTVWSTQV